MKNIRKLLRNKLAVALGLVLIIVVYLLFQNLFVGRTQRPTYQTAKVERGTLITSVAVSGTVSFGNRVAIATSATGVVNSVFVQNGDHVTAGQKIAEVTLDGEGQQKQASAWASYLSAQNTLSAAKSKQHSLQSVMFKANQAFVNDKGVFNPTDDQKKDPKYIEENAEWLAAEADYKNQSSVISQAEVSLQSTWLSYQQVSSIITAPVSGTITNLAVTPGFSLVSSQSVGTISLEGNSVQVIVNLSEVDAVKVMLGQKVTVSFDAHPGKTFTGKVAAVNTDGVVSSGVTTYPATIVFDASQSRIYPNMSASVNIITNVKDKVLLVPTGALQTQGDKTTVRVRRNGKIEQVVVEVRESSETQTEVLSDLMEGDEVIIGTVGASQAQQRSGGVSIFGGGTSDGAFRPGGFGGGSQRR